MHVQPLTGPTLAPPTTRPSATTVLSSPHAGRAAPVHRERGEPARLGLHQLELAFDSVNTTPHRRRTAARLKSVEHLADYSRVTFSRNFGGTVERSSVTCTTPRSSMNW